jgi:hypothetical protein
MPLSCRFLTPADSKQTKDHLLLCSMSTSISRLILSSISSFERYSVLITLMDWFTSAIYF